MHTRFVLAFVGVFLLGSIATRADVCLPWMTCPGHSFFVMQWGLPADVPVTGDFDGDGKADVTVYRPTTGVWYVRVSSQQYREAHVQWGLPGDVPLPADFNGDGAIDFAVWRPSIGTWYVKFASPIVLKSTLGE